MSKATIFFLIIVGSLAIAEKAISGELRVIKYNCDNGNDRLVVDYLNTWFDNGKDIEEYRGNSVWDVWDLVNVVDDHYIVGTKVIEKSCSLSSGGYNVIIGPRYGNYNIQSYCGATITAWVEFMYNGVSLGKYEFENVDKICFGNEAPETAIIRLEIKGKESKVIEITTVQQSVLDR